MSKNELKMKTDFRIKQKKTVKFLADEIDLHLKMNSFSRI